MREGIRFGLRILGKNVMLLILAAMFILFISPESFWLQVLLSALLVAGFALLMWNEGGYLGERAETLRATLEARRARGEAVDPASEAKAFRPRTAVIGLLVAALPLLIVAVLNLASLPAYPYTLDPAYFEAAEKAAEQAASEGAALGGAALGSSDALPDLLPEAAATPSDTAVAPGEATAAPESATAPGETTTAPDEAADVPGDGSDAPSNPFHIAARIAFLPYVSLFTLLKNHLLLLYLLLIPLSFFLPAFELMGYLRGPKLRQRKLEAIKKGIRAKKRKERRERKPSGPKPEV